MGKLKEEQHLDNLKKELELDDHKISWDELLHRYNTDKEKVKNHFPSFPYMLNMLTNTYKQTDCNKLLTPRRVLQLKQCVLDRQNGDPMR